MRRYHSHTKSLEMIPSAASSLPMSSEVEPSGITSACGLAGLARRVDLALDPHRRGARQDREHEQQHERTTVSKRRHRDEPRRTST